MDRETRIASQLLTTSVWLIITILIPDDMIKVVAGVNATLLGVILIYYILQPSIKDYYARRKQTQLDRAGYESYKMEVKDPYDEI